MTLLADLGRCCDDVCRRSRGKVRTFAASSRSPLPITVAGSVRWSEGTWRPNPVQTRQFLQRSLLTVAYGLFAIQTEICRWASRTKRGRLLIMLPSPAPVKMPQCLPQALPRVFPSVLKYLPASSSTSTISDQRPGSENQATSTES